jgi:hypothetical protein
VRATEELAQNGVRRDRFLDWFGGARRTLCAPQEQPAKPSAAALLLG